MLTNVQPLVTATMARAFLSEPLPAGFALSSALVLGGVWLTQAGETRRAKPLDANARPA